MTKHSNKRTAVAVVSLSLFSMAFLFSFFVLSCTKQTPPNVATSNVNTGSGNNDSSRNGNGNSDTTRNGNGNNNNGNNDSNRNGNTPVYTKVYIYDSAKYNLITQTRVDITAYPGKALRLGIPGEAVQVSFFAPPNSIIIDTTSDQYINKISFTKYFTSGTLTPADTLLYPHFILTYAPSNYTIKVYKLFIVNFGPLAGIGVEKGVIDVPHDLHTYQKKALVYANQF